MKTQEWLRCACLAGLIALFSGLGIGSVSAASIFTARPDDPKATCLTPERFPVKADGVADDSAALQAAIDEAAGNDQAGILLIPSGRYRLGRTVYVWPGVRLIGYGKERPVLLLGRNTPGFQEGEGKYMLFFSGGRGRGENAAPRDGSPGTFYSALSNIDIEIEEGNPAAIGIRFHVAQHCFLSHMDFRLGSARAGLEDIGNEIEDLHFQGGQYAIVTGRSAPGWPILSIDCSFEGQSLAAIRSRNAGLAIVRPQFRNLPTALSTEPETPDQLCVTDGLLENISGPAFIISHEHNARTQVNFEGLTCHDVPTLVKFRESGKMIARSETNYFVKRFSHGLHLGTADSHGKVETVISISSGGSASNDVHSDIPGPLAMDAWVNARSLGAAGDGVTDDTPALAKAISKHRVIYLPAGIYRVIDTLKLRPDTILLGLHPSATVIYLRNDTPAFQNPASPRAVVEAPKGGSNILSGLGIYAGARNPSAVAVKWMAGEHSFINDVRFHGGHGTRLAGGIGDSAGRDNRELWDTQFASLWVTDGGGGVFKDIWTPSPYSKTGMRISNTSTRGRVYAMSSEHHVSNEMIIRDVSNWKFYALQFEEEREEGPRALPLLVENSSNLCFGNTFFYRVVSCFVPAAHAIRTQGSKDLRFLNTHIYSNSKVCFDSALLNADTGREVRDLEFAVLEVPGSPEPAEKQAGSGVTADNAHLEKLADGFLNISGAAVDSHGDLYFADPRNSNIFRWLSAAKRVERIRTIPQRPEQLAFDRSGNLLIVAYEGDGTVLAMDPRNSTSRPKPLQALEGRARPGLTPILPVNHWTGLAQFQRETTTRKPFQFVSPDGTTFIPASREFISGTTSWGVKLSPLLRAYQLSPAQGTNRFYVSNEAELQTWSFTVEPDGTLSDPKLFVNDGGESVAVDSQGRVFIAGGQVRVYNPNAQLLDIIEVPERPTGLASGGPDRKTLFITARSSLYSVRLR